MQAMNAFHQGQAPPQYFGPLNDPIFVGHLLQNSEGKVHEVLLGCNVKIEGIHIVPNQTRLPNFNIVGKTMPDLKAQKSFTFELHGRIAGTNNIIHLMAITVTGGVQWMPIDASFMALELDYVAMVGTFESLTIILHGVVSPKSDAFVPPYPAYLNNIFFPTEETRPISQKSEQNSRTKSVINGLIERDADSHLRSATKHLLKPAELNEKFLADTLQNLVSTSRANSLVSIDAAGLLMEKVFGVDVSQLTDDVTRAHDALQEVSKALALCWQVIKVLCLISLSWVDKDALIRSLVMLIPILSKTLSRRKRSVSSASCSLRVLIIFLR